jgi:hypothetical protein
MTSPKQWEMPPIFKCLTYQKGKEIRLTKICLSLLQLQLDYQAALEFSLECNENIQITVSSLHQFNSQKKITPKLIIILTPAKIKCHSHLLNKLEEDVHRHQNEFKMIIILF